MNFARHELVYLSEGRRYAAIEVRTMRPIPEGRELLADYAWEEGPMASADASTSPYSDDGAPRRKRRRRIQPLLPPPEA